MAVTLAQLKQRIRDNCYGPGKATPFVDVLAEALDGTETDIDVGDAASWSVGDVVEVQETGEQCLVRSVSSPTLTVIRGWNGTTAAVAADAGVLLKNPRFSMQVISDAINSTVASLEVWGIHGFGEGQITYDADKRYFELTDTDMSEQYGVTSLYYVEDDTLIPRALPFRLGVFNIGTGHASYSEGRGIVVLDWGTVSAGETVEYTYAKQLTATTLSDNQAELVVLGATALVLGHSIIPRTQDPGSRTDRTVQPGQEVRDGRWFQGEFFIRARAEAAQVAVRRGKVPGSVRINRARRWAH